MSFTNDAFGRMNEVESIAKRLMKEGDIVGAVRTLIEGGEDGLAFCELALMDTTDVPVETLHEVVELVADEIAVDHASRLASKWRIMGTLPDGLRKRLWGRR